jgi:hypothetical protein
MTTATLTGQVMMMFSSDSLVNITSPLDLDSLFYWFAADVGVTTNNNKVTQWNDLSGNGYHVTQADTSKAPTYSAMGGPGSRPTMTFDGTDDFLASAAHFWGSDDLTVIVVMKFANATRDAFEEIVTRNRITGGNRQWQLLGGNTADSYLLRFATSSLGTAESESTLKDGAKSSSFSIISVVSTGSAGTWFTDGSTASTTGSVTTIYNSSITQLGIGCNRAGDTSNLFLQGSISEIIVFSRALTTGERTAIENYLNKKYDLY